MENSDAAETLNPHDIVFECPICGKSMAIDPRGAGLLVTCPECSSEVQVPDAPQGAEPTEEGGEGSEQIRMLLNSLSKSQSKVQTFTESLSATNRRRSYLEKMRADHLARFEKIAEELALIQNAIDRVVTLIENADTGVPPDYDEDDGDESA